MWMLVWELRDDRYGSHTNVAKSNLHGLAGLKEGNCGHRPARSLDVDLVQTFEQRDPLL